jgi:ribosomal protein S18 acetylase RimI-like enzyme
VSRSLDERIADAWPAADTEDDGWRYRWTYGLTRRANSALALTMEHLDRHVARAEAFYRERAATPRVLVSTALGDEELLKLLASRGFSPADGTLVMTARSRDVAGTTDAAWPAETSPFLSADWFDAYWRVEAERGRTAQDAVIYREVLLAPSLSTVFALVRVGMEPIGSGQYVADDDWAGIQCMATHPAHRRRGVAEAILNALARAAASSGIESLYVAVMADNPAARRLYERAGFEEVHQYNYWSRE